MYKLETHLHTYGRSPCAEEKIPSIAEIYARKKYDGITVTDHYVRALFDTYYKKNTVKDNILYYLDGYYSLKKECEKYNIDVFLGMELLTDEFTYYKPDPPKAEMLIYGLTPEFLLDIGDALFAMSQKEIFDICNECGFLLFQSHPYRPGIDLLDTRCLHGVEVFNGHPGHNSRNHLAKQLAEDNGLLETGGSDFHFKGSESAGIYLKNPVKENSELVKEIKKNTHEVFKPA